LGAIPTWEALTAAIFGLTNNNVRRGWGLEYGGLRIEDGQWALARAFCLF